MLAGWLKYTRVDAALRHRLGALGVSDDRDHNGDQHQSDRDRRGRRQRALGAIELFGDGNVPGIVLCLLGGLPVRLRNFVSQP